jgi:sucrose-6-phosphate hydrolase SacC (GH32 family)
MIGDFDGEKFQPEAGKYRTFYGSIYAAQTYNNTPDNRRIQIGWGRIKQPGMPFNQMMLFPTELTLRSTTEGIRLYGEPIKEIEKLHEKEYKWKDLSLEQANEKLKSIKSDLLHIKASLELPRGIWYTIYYQGNWIVTFDGSYDMMNKVQYIQDKPGKYLFDLEVLIDRTSVEAFFEDGKMVVVSPLQTPKNQEGLVIKADGNQLLVHNLEVYELKSIWGDR